MSGSGLRPAKQLPEHVLCFSHLRWNFVFQRPQHLLTRFARIAKVTYFEEPLHEERRGPGLSVVDDPSGVTVVTPLLPNGWAHEEAVEAQRLLLSSYLNEHSIIDFLAWYYTPMALLFSRDLVPAVTVYDCMDELSAFDGAPPELLEMERQLLGRADVVFTGGQSLYEAKRGQHHNIYPFPSSIDRAHFERARQPQSDPADQAAIAHPRVGFFGVLDERLDRELLARVANEHPEWQLVLLGPVVKIRPEELPSAPNLHYLGQKSYADLPAYLSGWDVAILPFARNRSTRFISPTKTPEYLAAARPVVSTPIHDVVHPYGDLGLVEIAEDAKAFSAAIDRTLGVPSPEWLAKVDKFLQGNSWDKTFEAMVEKVESIKRKHAESSHLSERQEGNLANV